MGHETIFIVMIGILFILAIFDLVVGVSNDAVNFLVSAIGSKVAPFAVIMIVASLGVLVGATSSNGMMEVARKGIFNPSFFSFSEIMIIFLAVMLTDIILLDVFNTLGMPTSTTVSIVFELLGAAVAISLIIVYKANPGQYDIGEYINTGKALMIIFGILLSVVIAFSVGAIVQYFSRLLFSFNYKKSYKYFGALWGAIAITSITYFIMIKGMKGTDFAGKGTDIYKTVQENTFLIVLLSFVAWSVILAGLQFIFKVNIFKMIVLVGTFALAMAFSGNDLVNFIGVPLAGLASFNEWSEAYALSPANNVPDAFMMRGLAKKVPTPVLYLLVAGVIMVVTLIVSKKSRSVTETSLNLSRQNEGYERFEPSPLSRSLVRASMRATNVISKIIPKSISDKIDTRFAPAIIENEEEALNFDLIRASVNLMVAGILISIGTSFKLPLSTTYVTFMVAMGTSLADRAWGRESAVYRVSGVLSVIGGWFITALVAFSVAFIFAGIIWLGTFYAVFGLLAVAVFAMYRTNKVHKRRDTEKLKRAEREKEEQESDNIYEKCNKNVVSVLEELTVLHKNSIETFVGDENKALKKIKKLNTQCIDIGDNAKQLKYNVYHTVQQLQESSIESAPHYVQALDYLIELSNAVYHIVKPCYTHLNNNHKLLKVEPANDLKTVTRKVNSLFVEAKTIIASQNYNEIDSIFNKRDLLLEEINAVRKIQIKRIKKGEVGTRNSMLFLSLLSETKNIVLFSSNLLKAQCAFVAEQENED